MRSKTGRAMEMTGHGKRGKPRTGFPSFPTALGNRQKRDSHISNSPDDERGGKVEIQKQDSHFPTAPTLYSNKKGEQ